MKIKLGIKRLTLSTHDKSILADAGHLVVIYNWSIFCLELYLDLFVNLSYFPEHDSNVLPGSYLCVHIFCTLSKQYWAAVVGWVSRARVERVKTLISLCVLRAIFFYLNCVVKE